MNERRYPKSPLASVSGVVLSGNRVLLIKRKKPPNKGIWTIPSGALELGETQNEAIVREVREEAGIESEVVGFLNTDDIVLRDSENRIEYQYMVNRYVLSAKSNETHPGEDEADADWFNLDHLPVEEMCTHIVELLRNF